MKTLDKITLALLVLFALSLVREFAGGITGLTINDDYMPPTITVTSIDVFDQSAEIKWETNEKSKSLFSIEKQTATYDYERQFEISVQSLSPERKYEYSISACDERNNCEQYKSAFTTLNTAQKKETPTAPAPTGASITNIQGAQSIANSAIFLLIIIAASTIIISTALQKGTDLLPEQIRLGIMINNAEALIREKKHEDATETYKKIRRAYENVTTRQKGKYQKRALGIYSELVAHSNAKEANILVDKYLEGTITKYEMTRLRELLES